MKRVSAWSNFDSVRTCYLAGAVEAIVAAARAVAWPRTPVGGYHNRVSQICPARLGAPIDGFAGGPYGPPPFSESGIRFCWTQLGARDGVDTVNACLQFVSL
jgi:hypothetical protein